MPSSFTPINLLDLIKGATSKTSDTDPLMSYHPVDLMRDVNAGHYFANYLRKMGYGDKQSLLDYIGAAGDIMVK